MHLLAQIVVQVCIDSKWLPNDKIRIYRFFSHKSNFYKCPTSNALHSPIVRSKYSLTPKLLLQKVSQLILVGLSALFNILKVYQSSFFQDGVQDGRRNLLMIITM